jgi:hypothetical protein
MRPVYPVSGTPAVTVGTETGYTYTPAVTVGIETGYTFTPAVAVGIETGYTYTCLYTKLSMRMRCVQWNKRLLSYLVSRNISAS